MRLAKEQRDILVEAAKWLCQKDTVLASHIRSIGPCRLLTHNATLFESLCNTIVSQQFAAKSARVIRARLQQLPNAKEQITAKAINACSLKQLQTIGLSNLKARALKGLASKTISGNLDLQQYRSLNNEDVISQLTQHYGIGPWTAEMFLIFGLGRLDVLSVGDAALKRAAKILYELDAIPTDEQMHNLSSVWRPYRSVGSWYLWRVLD